MNPLRFISDLQVRFTATDELSEVALSTEGFRILPARQRAAMLLIRVCPVLVAGLLCLVGIGGVIGTASAETRDRFTTEIRPLLEHNCLPCHGRDTQVSGLVVTTVDGLLAGGARHGPAFAPGHPEQSVLVRVLKGDLTPRMPLGKLALTAEQVDVIAAWIEQFKPAEDTSRAVAWDPFKPPVVPMLPEVERETWARNGIDRFILARLEEKGIEPAPRADRRLLLRRVHFDLVGEPPSPEEVEVFLSDEDPDAYRNLVDRLLDDPRYGERWGRRWLDLARYSDSTGGEANRELYHIWRYRDYVIDAFNDDKPYSEFVREQLAADEIAPNAPDKVVATGFLRLGSPPQSQIRRAARQQHLNELAGTVGSVFLGLSLGCAQCHDHKYDPIPTKDFYRLQAFFLPIENRDVDAEFTKDATGQLAGDGRHQAEARLQQARKRYEDYESELLLKLRGVLEGEGSDPAGADAVALRARLTDAVANGVVPRDEPNFTLEEKTEYIRLLSLIDGFRGGRDMGVYRRQVERHLPKLHTVANATESSYSTGLPVQFVRIRGEVDNLGERVLPGFPSAVTGGFHDVEMPTDSLGNINRWRLPLAEWIASPGNPLTARVMVNRVWQGHFGRGLVATPSNFGANGIRPTHPRLLDWLALEFIESGWSVKAMHRLILDSATYQQSSVRFSELAADLDPANALLARMPRRRLEGDVIRDTILAVSGRLNRAMRGPGVYPRLPESMKDQMFVKNWPAWEPSAGPDSRRRSIYVFQRRQLALPLLEVLDAPVPQISFEQRRVSTTAIQALALLNGRLVAEESQHFAARLQREAGDDRRSQIVRAFQVAFARQPSGEELARYDDFARSQGLVSVCRVLLNANEFIYVD